MFSMIIFSFLFISTAGATRCLNDGDHLTHDLCVFQDLSVCPVESYEHYNCTSASEMHFIKSWLHTQYNIDDSNASFDQYVAHALKNEQKPWLVNVNTKPEVGGCRAYISKFSYDVKEQSCDWFLYGGCGGNANKFDSIAMCAEMGYLWVQKNHDVVSTKCDDDGYSTTTAGFCTFLDNSKCDMEAYLKGSCVSVSETALIASWLRVVYSGFDMLPCPDREKLIRETLKDTSKPWVQVLKTLKPKKGSCEAHIRSFYYDPIADQCKPFIYGGCQGNANRFSSHESCSQIAHIYRNI